MQDLNVKNFVRMWRHRKWYFIIPALCMPIAAVFLAYWLPPIYESRSTILIEEQQIPPEFVRSTVTGYADQHVQILTQQILSRTKLWQIIEQFNLYPKERAKYAKEEVLEKMRKDITFQTISAEVQDQKRRRGGGQQSFIIAFSIAYQGENPATVQKVTGTLSSLYLEENLKYREEQAQTTTKFLEAESKQLRERIEELGRQIAAFKEKYPTTLPELQAFNQSQVTSLENDIRRLDGEIQTAQNQKIYLEGLLGTVQYTQADTKDAGFRDPRARYQAVSEELKNLQAKYGNEHPDVQRLSKEKAQLEQFLKGRKGGDLQTQWKLAQLQAELAAKQGKYSEQHPDIRKLKNEIALLTAEAQKGNPSLGDLDLANPAQTNLMTQLQQVKNHLQSLTQLRQRQQEKLAEFRHRLEITPRIEQEYFALQRDYQNTQAKYHEVMNKLMEARLSEGMEQHQKGEKFTIIDPASFPESPIKPKKLLLILAGAFLGVGAGAVLMFGRESLDTSIKSVDELHSLTKALPLGVIGNITTAYDLARQRRWRLMLLAATGISIVMVIIIFHFFVLDLYILISKFQRVTNRL
jgi:succinoglycan biosynthesis transport protein ExoP